MSGSTFIPELHYAHDQSFVCVCLFSSLKIARYLEVSEKEKADKGRVEKSV